MMNIFYQMKSKLYAYFFRTFVQECQDTLEGYLLFDTVHSDSTRYQIGFALEEEFDNE